MISQVSGLSGIINISDHFRYWKKHFQHQKRQVSKLPTGRFTMRFSFLLDTYFLSRWSQLHNSMIYLNASPKSSSKPTPVFSTCKKPKLRQEKPKLNCHW